jgi:hypothetical protein
MHSLREKMTELQTEMKRERRRELDAAAGRVMDSLRASLGDDLEAGIHALSGRLLTDGPSDADRLVLASLPGDDLHRLGTTAERHVVLLATIFGAY